MKTSKTFWHKSTSTVGKLSLDRDSRMHGPISIVNVTDANAIDYNTWGEVVTEYSACDLTFPAKDKLVAISSIARNLCAGDTYLAGLWKNDLPSQLNWMTGSRTTQCCRANPWRASSWSKASIDGPVFRQKPLRLDRSSALHILNAEVIPAKDEIDKFGQIIFGKIQLVCTLLKLHYIIDGPIDDPFCLIKDKTANLYHDVGAFQNCKLLTCMPIYLSETQCIGLILERSGGPCGEYFRVGRYNIRFHNNVTDEIWGKFVTQAAKTGKAPARRQSEEDEYMWHKAFIAASKSN